jgi:hypothetical protein
MDDQLRSFLAHLSNENGAKPKPQQAKPQEQMADEEVQQALAICNGDAIAALRITLIANAFLEAQIEHLSAAVSPGFARRKPRMSRKLKRNLE